MLVFLLSQKKLSKLIDKVDLYVIVCIFCNTVVFLCYNCFLRILQPLLKAQVISNLISSLAALLNY